MNDLLNKIQSIQNNINKKIYPIQNAINDVCIKIQPALNKIDILREKIKVLYDEKSLTDEDLESYEQIEILNRSLKLSHIKKYQYFQKDTRARKLKLITLLKNINRNHIQKNNNDEYIYSFFYELFTSREHILSELTKIKSAQKKRNFLYKEYKILTSIPKEYQDIFNSKLHKNQVVQFLYLIHHDEYKDTESIRVIFSILFYDKKEQKSFDTKLNELEQATNNIDFSIYHDFLQYVYLLTPEPFGHSAD
jgi:hypothetical protein